MNVNYIGKALVYLAISFIGLSVMVSAVNAKSIAPPTNIYIPAFDKRIVTTDSEVESSGAVDYSDVDLEVVDTQGIFEQFYREALNTIKEMIKTFFSVITP